jgi:hypothetical protein
VQLMATVTAPKAIEIRNSRGLCNTTQLLIWLFKYLYMYIYMISILMWLSNQTKDTQATHSAALSSNRTDNGHFVVFEGVMIY